MNRQAILDQLDQCARKYAFPMLDNGYIYPIDQRMTVMRSDQMWLMVIETLGFSPRSGGTDGIQNCLYLFGSHLHREPGMTDEDIIFPFDEPNTPIFDEEYGWEVNPLVDCVLIRGQRVAVDLRAEHFAVKGIDLIEPAIIDPPAFLRTLVPEYRDLLLANSEELQLRNPHHIPVWLTLEEWRHPDLVRNELPSQCETFQMLAAAIETGDSTAYRPTLPPNTHWRNWPDGGTL